MMTWKNTWTVRVLDKDHIVGTSIGTKGQISRG